MEIRVLLLTTDAYGGHGGIALYNRDLAQALAEMPEVEQVTVVPRNQPLPTGPIPGKIRFLPDATGSKLRFVRTAFACAREEFDLVICGHINLLPLAVLLNVVIRAPLTLLVYGIDVWQPLGAIIKSCLKSVDAVWSISAITRDRLKARPMPSSCPVAGRRDLALCFSMPWLAGSHLQAANWMAVKTY